MTELALIRERYQKGSLKTERRNKGGDVWVFRWREYRHDGSSVYRKKIVGSLSEFRTRAAAQKAVEGFSLDINATVSNVPASHTVSELISHYKETELASGRHTARVVQTYTHNLDDLIRAQSLACRSSLNRQSLVFKR